jgi:hypothetical protein
MSGILRSPMTLVMLAIFVVMVGTAATYPADTRFMPFVIGIPGILLCLLQVYLDSRKAALDARDSDHRNELEKAEERVSKLVGRQVEFEAAHTAPDLVITENSEEVTRRREFLIWGYLVAFVAGILLLGFWVAIPVFLAIFLFREAHLSPVKTLVYTALGTSILYGVFAHGLKLDLHKGFVVAWLLG